MEDVIAKHKETGVRSEVQRLGRFLSGMVMPNIGAFIAWGLITALFIPTGWIPNVYLGKLVSPMITYLLPLLIGYTGGHMVHGQRGAVVGAIGTMGVVVGADIPMFLGAMILGPLSAWVIKQFDRGIKGRVRAGFEMLVNNFSAGIIGAVMALAAYTVVGPIVAAFSKLLAAGVQRLIELRLLPLANILIEPGKVLFLNNAINHGVLSPIGMQQAALTGKSIVFMLEPNPGPGLGVLLAYWAFGRGTAKQSAPGAAIIQFLGGIHEIYFPYILMNPRLILATIAGGVTGTFTFSVLGAGLVAVPSPGSIFAFIAMAPRGGLLPVLAGVFVGAAVSFLVSMLLMIGRRGDLEGSLEEATEEVNNLRGFRRPESVQEVLKEQGHIKELDQIQEDVSKIVFSCDAGMGSSAMGASILRRKLKEAGVPVTVENTAISEIPSDADIVIT
ncbi:MAG: subunit of mannitol transporter, partial [Bacilli bacterium]|nr:subunit of mannitol transporter [Bacilli bacterium]